MAKTKNALKILDKRIAGDPGLQAIVAKETVNAAVAQIIYDARKKAGLTQSELAEAIGTRQPVIARLEKADYDGHSLSMLNRIAEALNLRLTVEMTADEPQVDNRRYVFQTLIQGLRKRHGLTVEQLAEKTDLEHDELLALERNPAFKPEPRTLCQLAEFYEVPEDRLLQLAGCVSDVPREFEQELSQFAAMSESFATLTEEEKSLVDQFVNVLKTKD